MPKFRRFREKDLKGNPLHRWLKFFDKMLSEDEIKELIEMDSAIKRAETKLKYLSSDDETIALYRAREDSLHERANMISSAKEDGKEEGRIEGKIEGKIETAKNMLSSGFDIQTISKITKISVDDLKKYLDLQ